MRFTKKLTDNISRLQKTFHASPDVIFREAKCADGRACALVFLEGANDAEAHRDLLRSVTESSVRTMDELVARFVPNAGVTDAEALSDGVQAILRGDTLLLLDGTARAKVIATAKWAFRAIAEPPTSSVLRGPREGFTEDLKINLTQIRRRLQTPDFVFRNLTVGRLTKTNVCVMYLEGVADPKIVERVTERIASIDTDGALDPNYLLGVLEQKPYSVFQQAGNCEKPDILAAKLLEGRVGVMCNGSPIAVTVPFVFFEVLQQAEDYYTRAKRSSFLRGLRLLAMLLGVLLPGLYVAVQVFHYTVIPLSYLYTLLNSVQGLPMSPLGEMIFVLLIFEILHEASFRMPRYVGMAMSVVGALVLGDTAVKAGLISSPSIMIIALSAISLYAVPEAVEVCKLLRLTFVLLGGVTGLPGMLLFGVAIVLRLASMDAYGAPYLAPYSPLVRSDLKDGLSMTLPLSMRTRPASFPQTNRVRSKGLRKGENA